MKRSSVSLEITEMQFKTRHDSSSVQIAKTGMLNYIYKVLVRMRRKGEILDDFLECNLAVNKICAYPLPHEHQKKQQKVEEEVEAGREGQRKEQRKKTSNN